MTGTAVGTKIFLQFGWRAAAAFSLGLFVWQIGILLLRGPHCERYTWFGYQGGLESRKKVVEDTGGILSYFWPLHPIRLFIDLLLAALRLVQPLAPQVIPLAVFSVSLPVILFLSVGSGYWVWKSVAVGWEAEIFLQYGYGLSEVFLRVR